MAKRVGVVKLGELLDSLFRLSREQRTDFGAALYYAPSEVSKFISGKRFPPLQRMEGFLDGSAAFFAEALWKRSSAESLREVFPVLRSIKSKAALEVFLKQALYDAYARSMEESQGALATTCLNHVFVQGKEKIFNHVLLTLSEAMAADQNVRVLITLSFFLSFMCEEILPIKNVGGQKIHVTVIVDTHNTIGLLNLHALSQVVQRWRTYDQAFTVDVVMGDHQVAHPFFHVRNHSLLTINETVPGAPYGVLIEDPAYLFKLGMHYNQYFSQRINFRAADVAEQFAQGAELVTAFDQIEAIYIFDSIGLPFNEEQLALLDCSKEQYHLVQRIVEVMHENPVPIVISWRSILKFQAEKRLWMPFAGYIELDQMGVIEYLISLRGMISSGTRAGATYFTQHDQPQALIVLLKESVMLLPTPRKGYDEMIFLFPKTVCPHAVEELRRLLKQGAHPIETDMLNDYLKQLPGYKG